MNLEDRLNPEDFCFDLSGNLVINTDKVKKLINSRTGKLKREPLKGGVGPL